MDFDFQANGTVDAIDAVPEDYRGIYEEKDGKFAISAAAKPLVDAFVGVSGALKSERGVTKTLKGQKDAVAVVKETFGFDTVEEAKAKFDELNAAVAGAAKVDPAKIKADIEKTFNTEREQLNARNAKMEGTLTKYLVDNAAVTALAGAKGNSKLLLPHIRDSVKVVQDGEDYVVRVLDAAGDYRGDGKGGFLTVDGLVAEMKASKDFAGAFESEQAGGGDDRRRQAGPAQRQAASGAQTREDMSATDLIAKGLAERRARR